MDKSQSDQSPSRRQFAVLVALLAAGPFVEGEAQAQRADPVTDGLFEIVRQHYGKFLTPAQLDAVKRSVARNQAVAAFLKEVNLQNSDEPAFAFRADLP